jgi:hypothetical protein
MATSSHAARNIAIASAGALLLWLCSRGKGSGTGSGKDHGNGPGNAKSDGDSSSAIVKILSEERLLLDGAPADLQAVVARARRAGAVLVCVAGAAREGWADQVMAALRATGVSIVRPPGPEWL